MSAETEVAARPVGSGRSRGGRGNVTGAVTTVAGALIVAYLFSTNPDPKTPESYKLINTALCLWAPLMVILFVLKQEPSRFGLTHGDRRQGLRWTLVAWIGMTILLAVMSRIPALWRGQQQYYLNGILSQYYEGVGPVFAAGRVHCLALVYYELFMGFYFFCWEFFFRGFLLFGLQKTKLGSTGAIIAQALVFMLLHWSWHAGASKPGPEVLSSLVGGILLGVLAVRTRSCLYGYLAHWSISVTQDIFLLAPFIFHQLG